MKLHKPFKALVRIDDAPGYRPILVTEVRPTRPSRWTGSAYELICSDNQTRKEVYLDIPKNRAGLRAKHRIEEKISKLHEDSRKLGRFLKSRTGFEAFTSTSGSP